MNHKRAFIASCLLVCLLLALLSTAALATDRVSTMEMNGRQYASLETLLAGTDITLRITEQTATLTEDGLTLTLAAGSQFIKRDGKIVCALGGEPVLRDGKFYVPMGFQAVFSDETGKLSLFCGIAFQGREILAALKNPDDSAFSRKLAAAVSLPTSMGIAAAHIDPGRVFVNTKLSSYPASLSAELRKLGYTEPENYTYTEYAVITGAQTLTEAGLASRLQTEPYFENQDVDPDQLTVAEFRKAEQDYSDTQFLEGLSEQQRSFMQEKKITLRDMRHLYRLYPGTYTGQSDDTLRKALTEYYEADLAYLRTSPFSDVSESAWYFEAALYVSDNGLMSGTGATTFSPDAPVTRGMLMTILARIDGADTTGGMLWYEKGMQWAKAKGVSDGSNPAANVTREQFAAMLWRYAGQPGSSHSISAYSDASEVSAYAADAMRWANEQGIISGSGQLLRPAGAATRAEAAQMLMNFLKNA